MRIEGDNMSKKKHKFRGYVAIALLAGGIGLAKTSGCSGKEVIEKVIEKINPDNIGHSNVPIDHKSVHELPVGDACEERVFDVGEHIVYMRVSTLDENGERINRADIEYYYVSNLPDGYIIIDNHFYQTNDDKYDVEFFYYNIVPVKATANENGEFLELGTPVLEQDLEQVYTR